MNVKMNQVVGFSYIFKSVMKWSSRIRKFSKGVEREALLVPGVELQ
jgi:hypothetical protein